MRNLIQFPLIAALVTSALAAPASASAGSDDGAPLSVRQRNPWSFWMGTMAADSEFGTMFQSSLENSQGLLNSSCGAQYGSLNTALFQSLGLDFGVGFSIATQPVDLRFVSRVETYGLTNGDNPIRPNTVFGVDALFRSNAVYFGPGAGVGYVSARTSGLTFQGAPAAVFSAVVGYDASQVSFVEARFQTAAQNAYRTSAVSFGVRF